MNKNSMLMSMALVAAAASFSAHATVAPTEQAAQPAKTASAAVNVTGAWAKEATAPRLTQNGTSVEAGFEVMLPVVKKQAQWLVTGQTNKKDLVRLALKSKDGSAALEMDISRDLRDQAKVKVGDAVTAIINQGSLLVFSKDTTPLGFMVKAGMPVSNLR